MITVSHVKQELLPQEVCPKLVKFVLKEHFLYRLLNLVPLALRGVFQQKVPNSVNYAQLEHIHLIKEVLNAQNAHQAGLQKQGKSNVVYVLVELIHPLVPALAFLVLKVLFLVVESRNVIFVQLELFHMLENLNVQFVL